MNSSEIDTTTVEAVDKSQKDDLQDPFNSSVSDFQKQRSAERRLRMKEFNYKFNKSKIDDIENEPAYKRRGIELENKNYSSISFCRYSCNLFKYLHKYRKHHKNRIK